MGLEADHQKLIEAFEEYKREYHAFTVDGKKVASARSRKQLSEMAKLAKELRKGISEKKNNMPTKKGGAKKKTSKKKTSMKKTSKK